MTLCIVSYVDDCVGCDPVGVEVGTGFVFGMISITIGVAICGAKVASRQVAMTILGIYIEFQFKNKRLAVRVQEEQGVRWAKICFISWRLVCVMLALSAHVQEDSAAR